MILLNLTFMILTIILFYTCKYIVNKYIRMIAILLFTVCLSLAITLGFGFNFIEYILTIFFNNYIYRINRTRYLFKT